MGPVDSGAGTRQERSLICWPSTSQHSAGLDMLPPPYPGHDLGSVVWETGPEPHTTLNRGPLAPRLRVECSWQCVCVVCMCTSVYEGGVWIYESVSQIGVCTSVGFYLYTSVCEFECVCVCRRDAHPFPTPGNTQSQQLIARIHCRPEWPRWKLLEQSPSSACSALPRLGDLE